MSTIFGVLRSAVFIGSTKIILPFKNIGIPNKSALLKFDTNSGRLKTIIKL